MRDLSQLFGYMLVGRRYDDNIRARVDAQHEATTVEVSVASVYYSGGKFIAEYVFYGEAFVRPKDDLYVVLWQGRERTATSRTTSALHLTSLLRWAA